MVAAAASPAGAATGSDHLLSWAAVAANPATATAVVPRVVATTMKETNAVSPPGADAEAAVPAQAAAASRPAATAAGTLYAVVPQLRPEAVALV